MVTVDGPAARCGPRCARLRRASRAHSRKARGSANRRKSAARLARIHARVANVRADALHKATTGLARRYETVVAEDLNVAGMTRNRRLARAISDQGFGQARRMLGYKTAWNGGTLILADRWYPVQQDLLGLRRGENQAGPVRAHLPLRSLRPGPGPGRERGTQPALRSPPVGRRAKTPAEAAQDPAPPGSGPAKQEPGTAHAGKTGTAGPQDPAASHPPTTVT